MNSCLTCDAAVAPGSRWCGICHANLVDPNVGRLASPGKRLGAYVLDLAVPLLAFLLILGLAGIGVSADPEGGAGLLLGLGLFVGYGLWALSLFARGTTPGKMLLGMRVVRENGAPAGFMVMLVREWVGKFLSGVLLSLGFFWILFDRDHQGWHDKLVSTFVVE